jgi:hypothetical protein
MAERIVSPGVFTNEVDQSFLPGAIAQIGAAIVGPTVKGPALIPTQVRSFSEFQSIFGSYTDESYVPFTVAEYLRNGGAITVTRLLYEDGYALTNGAIAVVAESGSGAANVKYITHLLHPTVGVLGSGSSVSGNYFQNSVINNYQSGSFEIKVSGSFTPQAINGSIPSFIAGNGTSVSASINPTENNYIGKIFGRNPKSIDYPVYLQYENKTASTLFNNLGAVSISLQLVSNYEFLQDYSTAVTPWITSQNIGSAPKNLLKFHTLSHGTSVNHETKVAITNIKTSTEVADPSGYGVFSIVVRRVNTTNIPNSPYSSNDSDFDQDIVETFNNVNLDPNSSRYIARVIGDRYQTINSSNQLIVNGDYPNQSKFIRVEVDGAVADRTNDNSLIPFGFRAVTSPTPMVSGSVNFPAASFKTSQVANTGAYNKNVYYGFDFAIPANLTYLASTPTSGSTTGSNTDFYLGNMTQNVAASFPSSAPYTGSLEAALTAGTFTTNVLLDTRKFIVPFQSGFDGTRPNLPKFSGANITDTNTFGFNCKETNSTGTVAYRKALTLLSNTDYYDINMIITPGLLDSLHSAVTSEVRSLAESRQDTFYVMDSNEIGASDITVTTQVTSIDSNYTATYWPWLRIINPSNNVPTWVPPSVVVPGALAFNDAIAAPWYAPAGLTRGGLTSVTDTYQNLSQARRDTMYENRVNPIANFPNEGIVIWGQKTLQARPSALDRVNVRRLLITVKKFIASATRYLVFEPNTNATRNRFLAIVNPYLEQVKAEQGLYAFRVVMDGTNNTANLIDQNILYGQLFLQPTRTAEFIVLDFNIQPTGAAFPE